MYRWLNTTCKAMKRMLLFGISLTLCMAGLFSVGLTQQVLAEEDEETEEAYVYREVASEEEAASLIWTVCSFYGIPENHTAAILGCLSVVSSLDPGMVEAATGEPFSSEEDLCPDVAGDLTQYTKDHILSYLQMMVGDPHFTGEYLAVDGELYPGLGLGQWRGDRARDFLHQADFLTEGNWNTMEFNIAYLMESSSERGQDAYGDKLCEWKEQMTLEEAVVYFAEHWLGMSADEDLSLQMERAFIYLEEMGQWTRDGEFEQTLKVLINRLDHHRVIETFHYDNSTVELAMVSLCYSHQGDGFYRNGTELYRTVRDNVNDPDVIYQSCDRLVGAAMRWSGADIDFPMGNVRRQYMHVTSSDQWELIAMADGISRDDLQPGDIFICLGNVGHIWMYVGQDAIRSIYGSNFWPDDADSASAGYMQWGPMLGNYFHMHIEQDIGYVRNVDPATGTYYDPPQFVPYYQFRMVYSDESDLYKDAADGDALRWPR